jgi:tripartite-type tricarboxylate transporter receptor subunit TctC
MRLRNAAKISTGRPAPRAPDDGYTLTIAPAGLMATNKSIFKSLAYDLEADFAPISRLVNQPMVVIVKDK